MTPAKSLFTTVTKIMYAEQARNRLMSHNAHSDEAPSDGLAPFKVHTASDPCFELVQPARNNYGRPYPRLHKRDLPSRSQAHT